MCTAVNCEIKTVPDITSSQRPAERQSSQTEILNFNQEIDKLKNTLSYRKTSDSSVAGDISAHNSNVRRLDANKEGNSRASSDLKNSSSSDQASVNGIHACQNTCSYSESVHNNRNYYYNYNNYYYLLQLSFHSVAVVLTRVETKQLRINIYKRNNTKTQYKQHKTQYTQVNILPKHPHNCQNTPTYTHPHIIKHVQTTTVQDTHTHTHTHTKKPVTLQLSTPQYKVLMYTVLCPQELHRNSFHFTSKQNHFT